MEWVETVERRISQWLADDDQRDYSQALLAFAFRYGEFTFVEIHFPGEQRVDRKFLTKVRNRTEYLSYLARIR